MATYDVLESRTVWEGKLSTARVDTVEMPDGAAEREVVAHLGAVAIVALTPDEELILVRQWRHPVRSWQLELPAGILDVEGEPEVDAAHRELAEETGMEVDHLERVIGFANSPGWTDERTTIYLGTGARPGSPPDGFTAENEEADMEVVRMPMADAVEAARSGDIIDAKTVIGILAVASRDRT